MNIFTHWPVFAVCVISGAFCYINIAQYCRAFDDNFKPLICVIKNNQNVTYVERPYPTESTQTTKPIYPILDPTKLLFPHKPKPRPWPKPPYHPYGPPYYPPPHNSLHTDEWDTEWDDSDSDCSCDLSCFPILANTNSSGISYRCKTCGSSCWLKTTSSTVTDCSCAVPTGNATCACSAHCAEFRMGYYGHGEDISGEDVNCVFSVNVTDFRLGEVQRPYSCVCCKSTEAEVTALPQFVCVCQTTLTFT